MARSFRGNTPQKRACLDLFALCSGAATAKKESDLAPEDVEEFQKSWGPEAPRRCRECNKALLATARLKFCNAECEEANKKIVCGLVERRAVPKSEAQETEVDAKTLRAACRSGQSPLRWQSKHSRRLPRLR